MRKSKCSDEKNARKQADLLITIKSITASVYMDDARKMRFIRLPFRQMLIDSGTCEIRENLEKISENAVRKTYV